MLGSNMPPQMVKGQALVHVLQTYVDLALYNHLCVNVANKRPLTRDKTECVVCDHSMKQRTLHAECVVCEACNWLKTTVTTASVKSDELLHRHIRNH